MTHVHLYHAQNSTTLADVLQVVQHVYGAASPTRRRSSRSSRMAAFWCS